MNSRGISARILLVIALASAGASSLSAQTDVHAIADQVDQRYNHMQTMQAQFTESYSGAGMKRTESGTLELKKPGRMRWDYDEPRPKMLKGWRKAPPTWTIAMIESTDVPARTV